MERVEQALPTEQSAEPRHHAPLGSQQHQHAPENWAERLHATGLRLTPGRLATLEYLDHHPHSAVADIVAALEQQLPSISTQSVSNVVHDLSAHGLVRRVDLPDSGSARYETRVGDNHHHVQCVVCGRIEDVDCVIGHAPCLTPSDSHGMRIIEADVTFRGVCPDCEARLVAGAGQDPSPASFSPLSSSSSSIPTEGTRND